MLSFTKTDGDYINIVPLLLLIIASVIDKG